jgi:BASS family bile acid:Na+ symporter
MATAPLIVEFALHSFMASTAPDIDITKTAFTMFLLSSLPILSGLALRTFVPEAMAAIEPILAKVAIVLFAGVIGAAVVSNWPLIAENATQLGPALLLLVVLLTVAGYAISRVWRCSLKEAKTISIETGVQNGTLGIGIAAIVVGGGDELSHFAIPSAVYSVIYLVTVLPTLLLLGAFKHRL